MTQVGVFPFGQPVTVVRQSGRGPRRVFVLGVYGSAVHARWIGADGRTRISALAVASEPEIFWTGEGAPDVVRRVAVPEMAGRLEPAGETLNGPSGRALDELYLEPLGITRKDAWLCDLVPHSCMNDGQAKAIERAYEDPELPEVCWPRVPKSAADWEKLVDRKRRDEIVCEIEEASPEVLITLGDEPLRRFARYHGTRSSLAAYGRSEEAYGRLREATVGRRRLRLLPLVHPRQAASLGASSPEWTGLHREWVSSRASGLLDNTDMNQPQDR